jgi:hypothetical protein
MSTAPRILDAALLAHRAGICVLPPREDGSKRPDAETWADWQERRPSEERVREWYADGRTGLGFVCGPVSGHLEALDFDDLSTFYEFVERVQEAGLGDLFARIGDGCSEFSPRGFHLFYRCKTARTEKLARDADGKAIIETKGPGGYIIVAPSNGGVHPSGKPYRQARGGPETIATISPEDREALHRIARTFDQAPDRGLPPARPSREPRGDGQLRPGDDFNQRTTWADVLEGAGWVRVFERNGETYWRRPGKDRGISATTNYSGADSLVCFSTSTPFDTERSYDRFGAYAVLHHEGDLAAAARDLGAQGYGKQEHAEPPPLGNDGTSPPLEEPGFVAEYEAELAEARDAKPTRPRLSSVSFSGSRFLDLADRPPPDDLYPGIPVRGHFNLLVAPPMTGKTSLVEWLAMATAAGVAPWEGAPKLGPGRVLMLSPDEAPEQVARRMRGLAVFHPAGRLDRYVDNLEVIGPDREIDPSALDGLRFDEFGGLVSLDHWLEEAEHEGRPFLLVFVDAYADMLPLGESENSNEEATRIGGTLERIAVSRGPGVTVLHHTGKPKADASDELPDVRFLGRGASALAAKARVVASLEQVSGMPHLRRVRTITNLGRPPKPLTLQVAPQDSEPGDLLYFRFHDPLAAHQPHDLIAAGENLTTNALAWRLSGTEPEPKKQPPGDARRLAATLREKWEKEGRIIVTDGPNRSKLIALPSPMEERGKHD